MIRLLDSNIGFRIRKDSHSSVLRERYARQGAALEDRVLLELDELKQKGYREAREVSAVMTWRVAWPWNVKKGSEECDCAKLGRRWKTPQLLSTTQPTSKINDKLVE